MFAHRTFPGFIKACNGIQCTDEQSQPLIAGDLGMPIQRRLDRSIQCPVNPSKTSQIPVGQGTIDLFTIESLS